MIYLIAIFVMGFIGYIISKLEHPVPIDRTPKPRVIPMYPDTYISDFDAEQYEQGLDELFGHKGDKKEVNLDTIPF